MSGVFWKLQSPQSQKRYIDMLRTLASLSHLFSDSPSPYLHYRGHENLFCEAFGAKNLSRGDISYDALKDGIGIGLKTFLNQNAKTFQKVAEFNSDSAKIRYSSEPLHIVHTIAELRNNRIATTQKMCESDISIYHLLTREPGRINLLECPMHLIDIDSIRLASSQHKNTIKFSDKFNEYSFSLSKNTLLQRFDTSRDKQILQIDVDILENPFEILKAMSEEYAKQIDNKVEDFIILPLYSSSRKRVMEKSGLNQWNAGGRKRHPDEVYIPIPAWIHTTFNTFFAYAQMRKSVSESAKSSPSFSIELPSGKVLKAKVAQAGGKALMSDPNKDLGKWLLRDILGLKHGELVTDEILARIGVDSVKLTKRSEDYYLLDFMESGSFEEFEENNK